MKKPGLLVCLLLLVGSFAGRSLPGQASMRQQLLGTWRLVSSVQRLENGTLRADPQTGTHGTGYLVYTQAGRVLAITVDPDRPRWSSPQAPTAQELKTAFDGFLAYAGTFEVNESEKYVLHHVEIDRVPNFANAERKRFCAFSGNRLILRPAPPLPAGVKEWTIIWQRVDK